MDEGWKLLLSPGFSGELIERGRAGGGKT